MLLQWWERIELEHVIAADSLDHAAASAWQDRGIECGYASVGNRADHLRRAMECLDLSLQYYTETEFPREWAKSQFYLGHAWSDLPTGRRSENLRQAIDHLEAALRVFAEVEFPREWALTQKALADVHLDRGTSLDPIGGGATIRLAVEHFENALRVLTKNDFPQEWAATQVDLGNAKRLLPRGGLEERFTRSLECYVAALRVFTEEQFPREWAVAQIHLGILHLARRPMLKRREDLLRAADHFEAALRVVTEVDSPREWAVTQMRLGDTYLHRRSAQDVRRSIEYFEAALRVQTETDNPQDWSNTQQHLGDAYRVLAQGYGELAAWERARVAFANAERGYRACGLEALADSVRSNLDAIQDK
jgi:tetratricopeptide (TPR) repeat protein